MEVLRNHGIHLRAGVRARKSTYREDDDTDVPHHVNLCSKEWVVNVAHGDPDFASITAEDYECCCITADDDRCCCITAEDYKRRQERGCCNVFFILHWILGHSGIIMCFNGFALMNGCDRWFHSRPVKEERCYSYCLNPCLGVVGTVIYMIILLLQYPLFFLWTHTFHRFFLSVGVWAKTLTRNLRFIVWCSDVAYDEEFKKRVQDAIISWANAAHIFLESDDDNVRSRLRSSIASPEQIRRLFSWDEVLDALPDVIVLFGFQTLILFIITDQAIKDKEDKTDAASRYLAVAFAIVYYLQKASKSAGRFAKVCLGHTSSLLLTIDFVSNVIYPYFLTAVAGLVLLQTEKVFEIVVNLLAIEYITDLDEATFSTESMICCRFPLAFEFSTKKSRLFMNVWECVEIESNEIEIENNKEFNIVRFCWIPSDILSGGLNIRVRGVESGLAAGHGRSKGTTPKNMEYLVLCRRESEDEPNMTVEKDWLNRKFDLDEITISRAHGIKTRGFSSNLERITRPTNYHLRHTEEKQRYYLLGGEHEKMKTLVSEKKGKLRDPQYEDFWYDIWPCIALKKNSLAVQIETANAETRELVEDIKNTQGKEGKSDARKGEQETGSLETQPDEGFGADVKITEEKEACPLVLKDVLLDPRCDRAQALEFLQNKEDEYTQPGEEAKRIKAHLRKLRIKLTVKQFETTVADRLGVMRAYFKLQGDDASDELEKQNVLLCWAR